MIKVQMSNKSPGFTALGDKPPARRHDLEQQSLMLPLPADSVVENPPAVQETQV